MDYSFMKSAYMNLLVWLVTKYKKKRYGKVLPYYLAYLIFNENIKFELKIFQKQSQALFEIEELQFLRYRYCEKKL